MSREFHRKVYEKYPVEYKKALRAHRAGRVNAATAAIPAMRMSLFDTVIVTAWVVGTGFVFGAIFVKNDMAAFMALSVVGALVNLTALAAMGLLGGKK